MFKIKAGTILRTEFVSSLNKLLEKEVSYDLGDDISKLYLECKEVYISVHQELVDIVGKYFKHDKDGKLIPRKDEKGEIIPNAYEVREDIGDAYKKYLEDFKILNGKDIEIKSKKISMDTLKKSSKTKIKPAVLVELDPILD